jgi:hypothetical protein
VIRVETTRQIDEETRRRIDEETRKADTIRIVRLRQRRLLATGPYLRSPDRLWSGLFPDGRVRGGEDWPTTGGRNYVIRRVGWFSNGQVSTGDNWPATGGRNYGTVEVVA